MRYAEPMPNIDYKGFYPYTGGYILTDNEYKFYRELIKIADRFNLGVLIKVRLADIIKVDERIINKRNYAEYMRYFGKIKSKHIDFVVIDKYTLRIVTAIELDDPSHKRQDRIERDMFVNSALTSAGINFTRCYNIVDIDNLIYEIISKW